MEKKLIEKGYVKIGSNNFKKISDKKFILTNSKGISSYDWTAGDNPSKEEESQMCFSFFYTQLQGLKKQSNEFLEDSFSRDLYNLSDTGNDAKKLAEHFFNGKGKLFAFTTGDNIVDEIKESSQFTAFKEKLLSKLKSEISDGSLKQEKKDGTYEILTLDIPLPSYGLLDAVGKNDDAATFVGGLQLCLVQYELYRDGSQYIVYIKKYLFFDTFGAGWDDACGTTKSALSTGLVSMFVLQHYRNIGNPNKYQPFVVSVIF